MPEMMRANERLLPAAAEHDLACWIIDHFQFDASRSSSASPSSPIRPGNIAGLRWGTLVLGQGYRNPALTAKIAATLQFLTGGRFILGLGAGDAEAEHHAYGYPFPGARVRVEQLDEAAEIIKLLWQGGPATFTGAHYRIENAYCMPAPEPPPDADDRRRRRAADAAASSRGTRTGGTATTTRPTEYARKLAILRDHCRAIGRDPDDDRANLLYGHHRLARPGRTRSPPVHGPSRRGPRHQRRLRTK